MTNDSSMNTTPLSERVQIGIFGRVNAGKSSVMNALTGQDIAVVADREGTTTDPVRKAMELLPIGPVMIYDTPGLSDSSDLGELREEKTREIIRRCDIAIIVIDAERLKGKEDLSPEEGLTAFFKTGEIPFLVILNKSDRLSPDALEAAINNTSDAIGISREEIFSFCALSPEASEISRLRDRIARTRTDRSNSQTTPLISDLIAEGDVVVLVVPVDESAPKGRLILPQQQVIRDILDSGAIAAVTQPAQLTKTLNRLGRPPRMVVTDSQAFGEVSKLVPEEVPLTSFSILMARYKGDLSWQAQGAKAIEGLKDGARVLISEGCTHHRQCKDIGTVKLPGWIKEHTGKAFDYHFTSGGQFPDEKELKSYDLIIHCGGCTLPAREMKWRIASAGRCGVPITNYGTMIAYLHGILDRSMEVFTHKI